MRYRLATVSLLIALLACGPRGPEVPPDYLGEYSWSNGYGYARFELSPDARFEYSWGGCVGVYGRGKGRYQYEPDKKSLTVPVRQESLGEKAEEAEQRTFVLVQWGERHFLLGAEEMPMFLCFVASSTDPVLLEGPLFLMRKADEGKPLAREPELAPQWRAYLAELRASRPDLERVADLGISIPQEWKRFCDWMREKQRWGR